MAKKILLADDSPTIRKVVELTFADEGIDVFSVPDGDAAMTKFVEIEPDLVIVDVNMPGMNGYRLCEMIKEDDTTRHIPVILLVGSFEPFDAGEASRVGSDYYFTKPFRSIRELVDKVHECFDADGSSAPVSEVADIESLYQESFQPETDETAGPEADIRTFGSTVPADDVQFDDGASLDEYFPESQGTQRDGVRFPPLRAVGRETGGADSDDRTAPERGFPGSAAAPAFEHAAEERDEVTERIGATGSPVNEEADDDMLGLGSGFLPNNDDDELVLDFGRRPKQLDVDPEPTPAENVPEFVEHSPSPARTTGGLGPSPWEQQVPESPAVEEIAEPARHTDILGDAGMDDEIIETSHPSGPVAADVSPTANVARINPFDEPVVQRSETVDAGETAQFGGYEGSEDFAGTSAAPGSDGEEHPVADAVTSGLDPAVTPQMIESIVARVLERMADRAVRDAAQEAVPRIAEKLIREALVDDKKDQ